MAATRRPPAKRQQQRKGKPATRNAPAKRAAGGKLGRAHAAGSAGHPAPAFVDDSASLEAYSQGRESWLAQGNSEDTYTDPFGPSDNEPAGELEQTGEPAAGGRSWTKTYGPYQPSGAQGDAAGLLLGFLATAFLINVLNGTWARWLRAKFLNDVISTQVIPGAGGATGQYNSQGQLQQGPPPETTGPDNSQTIPGGAT